MKIRLAALLLLLSQPVSASPGYTWNLSRDLAEGLTIKPFGPGKVWTAMYDSAGLRHQPSLYKPLPNFEPKDSGLPCRSGCTRSKAPC